jgi:hypothetical protein
MKASRSGSGSGRMGKTIDDRESKTVQPQARGLTHGAINLGRHMARSDLGTLLVRTTRASGSHTHASRSPLVARRRLDLLAIILNSKNKQYVYSSLVPRNRDWEVKAPRF